MKAFSSETVVRAARDQVSCKLEGEAVVLHMGSASYFGFDEVGSHIWDYIQSPRRVEEIRNHIQQQYDVDAQRCEADLMRLLEEMERTGLIERVGENV